MADRVEEESKPDHIDTKIPVFTVLKNGAILKNIFIVNNFPNPENEEEVIILGRHPDCNIMLTHPSISRFHLQIHSNPSSQKLCVVDLSSVHGTWVSGGKIEAGARVEMREGDTLRVGGSSRIYRLHWVPLNRVYDFEIEKKEEEVAIVEERAVENYEIVVQKENLLLDENKETVEDLIFGNIVEPLSSDESWSMEMMKEVTSAPPMSEAEGMVVSPVGGGESDSHSRNECPQEEACSLSKPFENESKSLFVPLSAENLSFNVENIIMSSFFGSENKSRSSIWTIPLENESRTSSSGNQQLLHHERESPQSLSLPLSAENFSFNVENIIMSSFFSSESKSSSSNTFEQEETDRIWTIQLENKSKNLSVVDDRKPAPEKFDNENQSPQTCFSPLCKENPSNVEDNAMFEQKEISSIMSIPLGHELGAGAVADDAKPISDNESQNFDLSNESPQSLLLSAKNLSLDVEDVVETQNLSVRGVKSLTYDVGIVVETVTEKEELVVEHELHPLEYNHSSVSTEEMIQETETLNKSKTEVEEVYDDEGNGDLYHTYQVRESLLDWQSQIINESSMKSTPEVIRNLPMNQNVGCCVEEKDSSGYETLEPTKSVQEKDHEPKELSEPSSVPSSTEFVNSSLPDEDVSLESSVQEEFQTPTFDNVSAMGVSIWLRRGKPTSFPRIKTSVSRANRVGTSLMDEINHEIAGDETVVNTLLPILGEEDEEEIFTPDKENFTPNTLLIKSLKKKANIEDSVKNSSKSQASIFKSRQKIKPEEELSEESDKENQTPRVLQEQKLAKSISKNRRFGKDKKAMKRGGEERAPFQSLQSNLAGKRRPEATAVNSARKSNISVCTGAMKNKFTEGKKRWTLVVDINSLLNKESMKSLQLLQGLQGTHLIVPRMVIRELDCLRRHGSLFRKATEAASILQWIEDCMVQTGWWIHVQSSEEGGGPPETPPATPQSPYTEGSRSLLWRTASSFQSITQRSFMEVLSPTAEDHILECALHFRRGVNHGRHVLLSDDVTLKIKAMAEGLICETAKEFRESLVNPFSERFLWADSSPRGLTWSCRDDVVLRERYDRCSTRSSKGTAEGAKGLKLILLHNSHYGMLR